MSDVRKTPVAITTSDWHLRTVVPASRSESDWLDVMGTRMQQLRDLQKRLGDVPIIVCGDLFDKHNPPASLVTWAMRNLPARLWCVCGQHDELGWDYGSRMRGAYGALVEAEVINDIPANKFTEIEEGLWVYGMPWGMYDLPKKKPETGVKIAATHKYMYATKEQTYVSAEEDAAVTYHTSWGRHFDVIAIGDNHIAWRAGKFLNHGSLFSMTSAQKQHEHLLGIVYSDGSLETVTLPEEKQWKEIYVPPESGSRADALLAELAATELDSVAFDDLLDRLEGVLSDGARAELRAIRQAD